MENATTTSSEVARVAVPLPPFWPERPDVWFSQTDSQFAIAGITSETTKFHYVVSQLEQNYATTSRQHLAALAFFSRKLNTAQKKYSAYERKLLAVYEAVKHFRHMLEARHFTIFTDHKPLTYAFKQKRDKCSQRQFNHLDFIAQFTTDIRHISGQENVVADILSRVESVTSPPSHEILAA
jgi:hypothetical protein